MSQPTILITGTHGQLGNECLDAATREPNWTVIGLGREELDFKDLEGIQEVMDDYKPDIIINCAAYTAVDKSETEMDLANLINAKAVGKLAEWSDENDALLVHISTDYVFNGEGERPYLESDPTQPINQYGASKLMGEKAAFENDKHTVILRTSWVYSEYGHNFVKTMLRLADERGEVRVVEDQQGSPTYAHDLAEGIFAVIRKYLVNDCEKSTVGGIYNYANQGVTSWYGFANKIFELANTTCKVIPVTSSEFPTPAKRPRYSVLNTEKYQKTFESKIPDWEDGLRRCLRNMQQ